ncbi:hypothetical protein RIF29_34244 [Crotalaria pallida]|uniref:K-box domain-containing protein n=1 Tax=Crotalaria pallida TaxID=3830 RepID=A0AAN9HXA6_CROPI
MGHYVSQLLILLIVYGRCFSINKTVERYQKKVKDLSLNTKGIQENTQCLKEDDVNMAKKIEHLEVSKRMLMGDGLGTCSIDELQQLEKQLERSLNKIRAKKSQLFKEQIDKLREEEKCLLEENRRLREQCQIEQQQSLSKQDIERIEEMRGEDEVETELFIGLPERRMP